VEGHPFDRPKGLSGPRRHRHRSGADTGRQQDSEVETLKRTGAMGPYKGTAP